MNNEVCGSSQRDNNHIRLNDAIYNMDSVIGHAEDLFERIVNGASSPQPCEEKLRTSPALAGILAESPDVIRKKNAQLHDILNKISEALF